MIRLVGVGLLIAAFGELFPWSGVPAAVFAILSMAVSIVAAPAIAPKPAGVIAASLFAARIVLVFVPISFAASTATTLSNLADACGLIAWTILAIAVWRSDLADRWINRATAIAIFTAVATGTYAVAATRLSTEASTLASFAYRALTFVAALLLAELCFTRARARNTEAPISGPRDRDTLRITGATGAFLLIALFSDLEATRELISLQVVGWALFATGYASIRGGFGIVATTFLLSGFAFPLLTELPYNVRKIGTTVAITIAVLGLILGAMSLFKAPKRPWRRAAAVSHVLAPGLAFLIVMFDVNLAITLAVIPFLYLNGLARLR